MSYIENLNPELQRWILSNPEEGSSIFIGSDHYLREGSFLLIEVESGFDIVNQVW